MSDSTAKKTKRENIFWSLVVPTAVGAAVSTVVAVVVARKTTELLEQKKRAEEGNRLAELNALRAMANPGHGVSDPEGTVYLTGVPGERGKLVLAEEIERLFQED